MKVTVLGCGPSGGVPSAGNNWGACDPTDPRNRRRRPSILVEWHDRVILVDTSPDLREQLLDANVKRIDAVFFTHEHADHVHGIDDLRPIRRLMGRDIDIYAPPEILAGIARRFDYLFESHEEAELYRKILKPHAVSGPVALGDDRVIPFEQDHGICVSMGYRFGRFGYSTDVVTLPEAAFAALAGVEVWIVDCLRDGAPHPTHANLETTLGWIERVRPQRAILTHMNHQADYEIMRSKLPAGVEPAYDGMVIDVPD